VTVRPLVLVLALAGCSDSLDRSSELAGLRVLAIAAEPTGGAPGQPLSIRALWWSPDTAPPTFRWSVCRAPGDGSIEACAGEERPLDEGPGLDALTIDAPAEAGEHLVRLSLRADAQDEVVAAKRVSVGDDEPRNLNPTLEGLALGEPDGDGERELVATIGEGSAEALDEGDDGDEEELLVSWYASSGEVDDDRSFGPDRFATRWTPAAPPVPTSFFAVLRDGRGGVAWASAASE